jgi:hypothetical protein
MIINCAKKLLQKYDVPYLFAFAMLAELIAALQLSHILKSICLVQHAPAIIQSHSAPPSGGLEAHGSDYRGQRIRSPLDYTVVGDVPDTQLLIKAATEKVTVLLRK